MEKEDIISSGLLEAFALGAASADEAGLVQAACLKYPEVQRELQLIEDAMQEYAFQHSVKPDADLKSRIMSSIRQSPALPLQPARVVSMSSRFKMVAAAAVALLLVSSVFNYIYYNKFQAANSRLASSRDQVAEINERLSGMDHDMGIIRSKYSVPVALGPKDVPDAAAKIFWLKNTGEVYVDPGNLPLAPKGMQYQFWGIVDGKPVSGGMITSKDGKTYNIQPMKTFGKAEAFAITLETEGGNDQPKGKMYVEGKII